MDKLERLTKIHIWLNGMNHVKFSAMIALVSQVQKLSGFDLITALEMMQTTTEAQLSKQYVYKLTQDSWEGGSVSDFSLPKTLGYYSTAEKAESVRDNIMPLKGYNKENWCDERDYNIIAIEVKE